MSRLPIRARLTAAFALALVLVLVAAGLFVYLRLSADLDESVDAGLTSRAAAVAASRLASAGAPGEPEEGFAQLLDADGTVLDATAGERAATLTAAELERALAGGTVRVERELPGIEGTARVLAVPATGTPAVAAVGQSLDDRDETLAGLAASFAIGGPIAVALASLLGYALAAAGLRPVEAMRRQAARVTLDDAGERLPLPTAHDEIRRLGETLNEMLDRLRRSHEREARFVGDASHELRTPAAVIRTELEAALRASRHSPLDPEVRSALVAALEECDNLILLAEDLLVLARTAEHGLPMHATTLDAGALLDGVLQRFSDRARERDRTIRVDAVDGITLHGDELRLRQALGNLVDNALRHGAGEIALRAAADGDAIALEVGDEGPGFPPELAERAFERFARGDAARTRAGAGLGLAIVRAIAVAHGGRAEIVRDGPGTVVRIRLPPPAPSQRDLSGPS